jgi:hypothetical protein
MADGESRQPADAGSDEEESFVPAAPPKGQLGMLMNNTP